MKRIIAFCGVLFLLSACAPVPSVSEQVQRVYFAAPSGHNRASQLIYEMHSYEGLSGEERLTKMIGAMSRPQNPENRSLMPRDVTLLGFEWGANVVSLDFSSAYADLEPFERSMLASAVALTVFEIGGIDFVRITADGESQTPVTGYFSRDTVMLDDGAIKINTFEVMLYYVDTARDALLPVPRVLKTTEDAVTPEMVLHELFSEPDGTQMRSPALKPYSVGKVSVEDGICTIELTAQEGAAGALARTEIFSIVNTLCGDPAIVGVRFLLDGQSFAHAKPYEQGGALRSDESIVGY